MSDYFGAMGTALFGRLSGGTALITALGGTAIYAEQAPDGARAPFVVFSHQGGGPENLTPRAMRSNVWYVRAYAATQAQAGLLDGLVAQRLDATVTGALSVSGWTNFWLAREQDVSLRELLPNGEARFMAGGFYRVRLGA